MIYVDSPAGAGLSFSETSGDYHTDDGRTVDDLVTFLQGLMEIMPELSRQDFYIAGAGDGMWPELMRSGVRDFESKG